MKLIVNEVVKVAPYMKDVLVPLCQYRNGKCTEMFPCNKVSGRKVDANAQKADANKLKELI